jgi:hypothetical protein
MLTTSKWIGWFLTTFGMGLLIYRKSWTTLSFRVDFRVGRCFSFRGIHPNSRPTLDLPQFLLREAILTPISSLVKPATNTPSWIFLSLVGGFGTGMLFSAQGFAAQASASNADLPFAGAM